MSKNCINLQKGIQWPAHLTISAKGSWGSPSHTNTVPSPKKHAFLDKPLTWNSLQKQAITQPP